MSPISLTHLPLGNVPKIVSTDPPSMTAWDSINAWYQKVVDNKGEKKTLLTAASFIMMACRFINLRVQKMTMDESAPRLAAGLVIKKMQEVSGEFKKMQAVTDWLGQRSSLKASFDVGTVMYNTVYQQKHHYGATQPLSKGILLPIHRVWTLISLMIEIAPEPLIVKSRDVKDKLAWLQAQLDESSKRLGQDNEDEKKSKKVKTAIGEVLKRIEVIHPDDLEIIKRYDNNIGVVPTEGSVKNRSVVTAYDVSTLSQGQWVNDVAIDAHLTLVCHTFNGLFQGGDELPKSPKYHAWSVTMSVYLKGRVEAFEEKHLRREWPPARFPDAALEDVSCHIFPIHVRKNHWILMVLQKMGDGQWTLFHYSSLAGYDKDFEEPWQVISSWLLFKSKGTLNVTRTRVIVPNPQPTQDNDRDCGVFVCGIVRWSLADWDLSTLAPSIIPEYRRRMMLELENWRLSTNRL